MQDDTGKRSSFLATLGITQWKLKEEYSQGSQGGPDASEGSDKHQGVTISLQGLSEALGEDVRLALRVLDLDECLVEGDEGGKLVVRQDERVHLELTSDELGSPQGKRRLWSALREVA